MSRRPSQGGFTLLEVLLSLALLLTIMASVAGILIRNGRINRSQQMAAELQSSTRTSLSMPRLSRTSAAGFIRSWSLGLPIRIATRGSDTAASSVWSRDSTALAAGGEGVGGPVCDHPAP